jgi:hypothetical protein
VFIVVVSLLCTYPNKPQTPGLRSIRRAMQYFSFPPYVGHSCFHLVDEIESLFLELFRNHITQVHQVVKTLLQCLNRGCAF